MVFEYSGGVMILAVVSADRTPQCYSCILGLGLSLSTRMVVQVGVGTIEG